MAQQMSKNKKLSDRNLKMCLSLKEFGVGVTYYCLLCR